MTSWVWVVDPMRTRHLQFLLGWPDDLGARAELRRHYECPLHEPAPGALMYGSSDEAPRSTCSCGAALVLFPAELATERHVGPRRVGRRLVTRGGMTRL